MNTTELILTPAQNEFLKNALPDFSLENWKIELAGKAASQRCFYRVHCGANSYILMVWDGRDEDWGRFLGIEADLSTVMPFLPKIYKWDEHHGLILEEDLGSITLKRFCMENEKDAVVEAYKHVLDALNIWQTFGASVSSYIAARSMDLETFLWETGYFARFCVKDFCGCDKLLDTAWEKERYRLASEASSLPRTCLHRDFQSENVMLHDKRVRFVDFQGARLGPPEYDVASLLYDPYIDLLDERTTEKLYTYYRSGKEHVENRPFDICAAQRLMQALGAYGNLSIHKGKSRYKDYIPPALKRLDCVLERLPDFPVMKEITLTCRKTLHC